MHEMKREDLLQLIELQMKHLSSTVKANMNLTHSGRIGTRYGHYAVRKEITEVRKHLLELSNLFSDSWRD